MSKLEVKLLGEGLAVGESTDFLPCPFCYAKHEQKFSVTRSETGLLYNCFRASCSASGFVGGYYEVEPGLYKPLVKRKPYLGSLNALSLEDKEFFAHTWNVYPRGFMATADDEYALPMLAADGFRRGWVIRQPRWKGRECHKVGVVSKPKALTYKDEPSYTKLSWAPGSVSDEHVVIVEDILSAWKVTQSTGYKAVALNGAQLGYAEIKEICELKPVLVTVWLDPDATKQAYAIQAKWGLSFNHCAVTVSKADPKDITRPEIAQRLADDRRESDSSLPT